MLGDQADIAARIRALLPFSWFQGDTPVVDAITQGPAWALSSNYSQITYAALQSRIKTATDGWLDIVSQDFFGATLPRIVNETDANFRARILANLFIKGPTRANMSAVIKAITGRTPDIFEPSNTTDSGGWDTTFCYDANFRYGDALPYQSLITVYRPVGAAVDLGEFDAYTFSWDSWGSWSDQTPTAITDAVIIAAVESTKVLGTTVWLRILDNPLPIQTPYYLDTTFILDSTTLYDPYAPV